MIICHNKKFIFFHVPKAAGSSIKNYLKGFLKFDDVNCQLDGADINARPAGRKEIQPLQSPNSPGNRPFYGI